MTPATARHPADGSLALEYLRAIVRGHDVEREASWFVVPGKPQAWERTGSHRGRFYTQSATRAAEAAIAMFWRAAARGQTFGGNVAVAAVFYLPDARTKDGDNLLKLLLDAGSMAEVWADDSHVTVHTAGLELDRVRPRTVVAFCPTESSLARVARRCGQCEAPLTRVSKGLCRCGQLNRRRGS